MPELNQQPRRPQWYTDALAGRSRAVALWSVGASPDADATLPWPWLLGAGSSAAGSAAEARMPRGLMGLPSWATSRVTQSRTIALYRAPCM